MLLDILRTNVTLVGHIWGTVITLWTITGFSCAYAQLVYLSSFHKSKVVVEELRKEGRRLHQSWAERTVLFKQSSLLATWWKILESYKHVPYKHMEVMFASGNNSMNKVFELNLKLQFCTQKLRNKHLPFLMISDESASLWIFLSLATNA